MDGRVLSVTAAVQQSEAMGSLYRGPKVKLNPPLIFQLRIYGVG